MNQVKRRLQRMPRPWVRRDIVALRAAVLRDKLDAAKASRGQGEAR